MPDDLLARMAPDPEETLSTARQPLLAYATDRATLAVLSDALASALGAGAEFRLGDMAEARAGLQRLHAPLAALIVDVSGAADPFAALEELATYVDPAVRVCVIGDVADMDFYRQVTRRLGASEYLCKPLSRDQVARGFLPAITGGGDVPARSGRVVTVTGVRGGAGASTIAVNLAVQLSERARHHVLLFDADLHAGTTGLMLSAPDGGGLRAALEHPDRVDNIFAERSAPALGDRLRLLAAEEALDSPVSIPPGSARHLTTLLCNRYNLVVIDLPGRTDPLTQELRGTAHLRVLVMDPTLAALRDMLRHLALPAAPLQASRPVVVLNRAGMPGALTRRQVEDGLGIAIDVAIPWLPRQLHGAATLGEPMARRRGPFQAAVATLADQIVPRPRLPARSWFGLRRGGRA
ncbi:Type II/IV secretion system ATPase TadZ/CpaE, associated with Flp pilus assembly [Rhodovastum atsumiense]|uniref:Pilus assembly protein n=1 Tax=Rhodovastum atsumiense TaxID=504468 RepID=A0A5M6IZW7_9PROT|nr:pilus assembly protein [Rhodovastum atsumiense]KAA5613894.1 pilus assembly protein [Rhodovastum atsumiense]CAH2602020.1 Type II/IV secretion system ATPase TadZ/CpaE, associated with Flp pilus assembly [Rhodovastum atsumiense]